MNESDLNRLVKECVKRVLKEERDFSKYKDFKDTGELDNDFQYELRDKMDATLKLMETFITTIAMHPKSFGLFDDDMVNRVCNTLTDCVDKIEKSYNEYCRTLHFPASSSVAYSPYR